MVVRTNRNAPNFRLVVIDVNEPAEQNWSTLIAVSEKLELIYIANDFFRDFFFDSSLFQVFTLHNS